MRTFKAAAVLLAFLAAPAAAQYYPGNSVPIHGHSANNDGGQLSNLSLTGGVTTAGASTFNSSVTFKAPTYHGAAGILPGIGFSSMAWITTSSSWVVPTSVYLTYVQCWGGGGAGGRSTAMGGGGGGGGYSAAVIQTTPGSTYYALISTGGAQPPASVSADGYPANPTKWGNILTANGGGGGLASGSGGTGGTASGGTINISGSDGGGGGSITLGGASPFGGSSAPQYQATGATGSYGNFPGGGSAGGGSSNSSRVGAAGACLVWY